MDHPTNDQPVALMPKDQLPCYNQHGQCISGSYMQATTALRAATSSTASYITTPGPVLHNISHVYCEEIDDYNHNVLEINYNQQLTNGMNPDYACTLPEALGTAGRYWCLRECGSEALRSGGTTGASTTSRTTTHSDIYPHQNLRDKDSATGSFSCSLSTSQT